MDNNSGYKNDIEKYFGVFNNCYFGYANDSNIRENAASGGIITAILAELLNKGIIDGALVIRLEIVQDKVQPVMFIARNYNDLLASQGSKYIAVDYVKNAIPLISNFDGKLGVVGLPCDIALLRKYSEKRPEIAKKLYLQISLFCGHNSTSDLTELVLKKISPKNVKLNSFRFRRGHWRGNLEAKYSDGSKVIKPFSFFSDYQNLFFFCQPKCLHCYDHTGYFCDISVGDIWSNKMKKNPIKHNAIITRSSLGEQIIQEALDKQVLIGNEVSIEEIFNGQKRSLPFHYNISARAKAGKYLNINIKDYVSEKVTWHEFLAALIVLINQKLSISAIGKKIINHMPRIFIKIYLYLFKGIESLKIAPKSYSISIIGGTIWGNRGAEAMLVTTIGKIREINPKIRINVFSYYPSQDKKLLTDESIKIFSSKPITLLSKHFPFALLEKIFNTFGLSLPKKIMPGEVNALRESLLLLDIGGITFSDGRELFLPYNILTIYPAILLNTKVVKLSQAMGPFTSRLNLIAAKLFLPKCEKIFARGENTATYLNSLAFSKTIFNRVPDIAFLYKPKYSLSIENEDKANILKGKLESITKQGKTIILFSPSSLVLHESKKRNFDYSSKFIEIIKVLGVKEYHYVVIPNATREGSQKLRNNDIVAVNFLMDEIRNIYPDEINKVINYVDYDINTKTIREIISFSSLLVTSRFHAMIAGLSLSIPTVVIGWGHKYKEVLSEFGLGEYSIDFNDNDFDVKQLITAIITKREDVHQSISRKLSVIEDLSEEQIKYLETFIIGKKG